jgi:hypothetical protein
MRSGPVSEAATLRAPIVAGSSAFVLEPAALHGLPGETVRMIEPVTEAAPAAVLVTLLAIFGAAVGPAPYVLADGARHGPRIFAVIVGKTARARKGTSYRVARHVMQHADPVFFASRVFGGFGSGEALIEAVGEVDDDKDEGFDDGSHRNASPRPVYDPRALVVEEEFARVLRVAERDGSTLSPVIRQAWDDGELSVLTRKKPVRARGAHVAVIAHSTEEELLARLRGIELANGFGNRFLFVRVERSKRIPDGHGLDRDEAERLGSAWRKRFEQGRKAEGPVKRSREADALWRDWYLSLDDDRPGMIGALLARAEAHVLRLSLGYALADGEAVIDVPHLHAALALWKYAERSAYAIFGDAVGDPVADLILRRLRYAAPEGLTRTDIWNNVLAKNGTQVTVQAAFDLLESRSLAHCVREGTGERGRPAERWYATSSDGENEITRKKSDSSVSSVFSGGNTEPPEAAMEGASGAGTAERGEVQSPLLTPTSNNPHLVFDRIGGGHLHEQNTPPAGSTDVPSTDAELRRWAAEENG